MATKSNTVKRLSPKDRLPRAEIVRKVNEWLPLYQVAIRWDQHAGAYAGRCIEIPKVTGSGVTEVECIADVRENLRPVVAVLAATGRTPIMKNGQRGISSHRGVPAEAYRAIMTASAHATLARTCTDLEHGQKRTLTKLHEWFGRLPRATAIAVLGLYPKSIEADVAKLILSRQRASRTTKFGG